MVGSSDDCLLVNHIKFCNTHHYTQQSVGNESEGKREKEREIKIDEEREKNKKGEIERKRERPLFTGIFTYTVSEKSYIILSILLYLG